MKRPVGVAGWRVCGRERTEDEYEKSDGEADIWPGTIPPSEAWERKFLKDEGMNLRKARLSSRESEVCSDAAPYLVHKTTGTVGIPDSIASP